MSKSIPRTCCAIVAILAFAWVVPAVTVHAGAATCDVELDDLDWFIELNGTDGDAGVQLDLDGDPWDRLQILDPSGSVLLEIGAPPAGALGRQGLVELFFESSEPSFDEQTLQEFFDLFPEGSYAFVGVTTDGATICGTAEFTHDVPAIPETEVELEFELEEDGEREYEVEICWEPVTDPFDDPNGADVGDDIEIASYRLIVEALDEEGESNEVLDVELPGDATCMSVPEEFLAFSAIGVFEYEVLAKEDSGNQTIFEGEFDLADAVLDEEDDCEVDDDEDDDSDEDDASDDDDSDDDDSDDDDDNRRRPGRVRRG